MNDSKFQKAWSEHCAKYKVKDTQGARDMAKSFLSMYLETDAAKPTRPTKPQQHNAKSNIFTVRCIDPTRTLNANQIYTVAGFTKDGFPSTSWRETHVVNVRNNSNCIINVQASRFRLEGSQSFPKRPRRIKRRR